MKKYIILLLLYITTCAQNFDKLVEFDPLYIQPKIYPLKKNESDVNRDETKIYIQAISKNCKRAVTDEAREKKSHSEPHLKCVKNVAATIGLFNSGNITPRNKIIVVNHLIDPRTGKKSLLLNPYVIMFRQDPFEQLYGLQYKGDINGEATEEVINKRNPGFRGCDDFSESPTCGRLIQRGKYIPYSQGFCCSCDELTNIKRQPRNFDNFDKFEEPRSEKNIFKELLTKVGFKRSMNNNNYDDTENQRNKRSVIYKLIQPFISPYNDEDMHLIKKEIPIENMSNKENNNIEVIKSLNGQYIYNKTKKTSPQNFFQIRGGQNCLDTRTPIYADPKLYHESAHCLRYSNQWYSVYKLQDPILKHNIKMKVFEKRESDSGSFWLDLTNKREINIGTIHTGYMDDKSMLMVNYEHPRNVLHFSLNPNIKNILIPTMVSNSQNTKKLSDNAAEYIVVDQSQINEDGSHCDKIGVGPNAFFHQENRCNKPAGSCLRNQPLEMWRRDKAAAIRGEKGQYLLQNYADISINPLRISKRKDRILALKYNAVLPHKSRLKLHIRSDDNTIYNKKPGARITEVYTDATSSTVTEIQIKIHNNGLVSNIFRAKISDCPLELPASWNIESSATNIPPQLQVVFSFQIQGYFSVMNFYCVVQAIDCKNEIVAVRRIRIIKNDRCLCTWHCLCACLCTTGLSCVPMSLQIYHAAGFIGSMPLTTNIVQVSTEEVVALGFFTFFIMFIIILFLLGITKGMLGLCCCMEIGVWGLDVLLDLPRRMTSYNERSLRGREVIYDCQGWPIHPDTEERTVRNIDKILEFFLNVVFFFTYPVKMLILVIKDICCPFYTYEDDDMDGDYCFHSVDNIVLVKGCPNAIDDNDDLDEIDFESESSKTTSK